MKMTTRVALDNMKYYKNRNILIGITIILTTMLLFIVPAVGRGMLEIQFAVTDRLYPSWHALYRNVDEETARKLAVHHDISKFGLRSDAGYMNLDKASVVMMYVDEAGMELYKMAPAEGTIPRREDEIVVSPGILKELGQQGDIGDTVTVPYQIFRGGELDLTQQKEFRICGFFEDSEDNYEKRIYTALVSEAFLKNEIPKDEIAYRFLLQIGDEDKPTTDEIEDRIKNAAEQFGIPESEININTDYLMANYVDPVMVPAIVLIMLIVMLAGAITIYSIYYVSMNQRIREFGRMKAIGATKRQIRQIVLREGLCIAAFAVPAVVQEKCPGIPGGESADPGGPDPVDERGGRPRGRKRNLYALLRLLLSFYQDTELVGFPLLRGRGNLPPAAPGGAPDPPGGSGAVHVAVPGLLQKKGGSLRPGG